MGAPGPLELLVVAAVLLVTVLVPVVIIFGLLFTLKIGPFRKNNPNLRPCPDCGSYVSRRAVSCPHCGCPLEQVQ
jgi:hypothetical protein